MLDCLHPVYINDTFWRKKYVDPKKRSPILFNSSVVDPYVLISFKRFKRILIAKAFF